MSSFCRLKGCLGTRDVEILAATLRKLTPRMSYPRCPGTVERAFAPLVEHFGYAWAIGGRSENRSVYHLEDQLGPALTGALEELDLWSTAVHVVDLHGDRSAAAALYPELAESLGPVPLAVDAARVERIGQAMLQLLVSAARSESGILIHQPSPVFTAALQLAGLDHVVMEGPIA